MFIYHFLDNLSWKSETLVTIISCLLAAIIFVVGYLIIYLSDRKKEAACKAEITRKFQLLVEKAIFHEDEPDGEAGQAMVIPKRFKKFMKKEIYRNFLLQQIVDTRKYISGAAADHLEALYLQLDLHHYSLKKMNNRKWFIKAQGIQELAVMNQTESAETIRFYTTHKNSHVRLEAQAAMVKLFQFKGLAFLDTMSYELSDWQQIQIMEQLPQKAPRETEAIKPWLLSSNQYVVIFAMRLIYNYRLYQLHDELAACLQHPLQKIREKAAKFLANIYNENTAELIIKRFNMESKNYQLNALNTLRIIGDASTVPFLYRQLSDSDYDIKLAAAKAILECAADGSAVIANHPEAGDYPLNIILMQFKAEQAA